MGKEEKRGGVHICTQNKLYIWGNLVMVAHFIIENVVQLISILFDSVLFVRFVAVLILVKRSSVILLYFLAIIKLMLLISNN